MADKKISQLTGASTPLAGTEVLPIVQGGSTVKVSVANLTAGRTVDATTVNATTVDATDVEVTNVKAKDGTAAISIADSTGAVAVSSSAALNGGVVINEPGADVDFRVESDTDANCLFVDASANNVGIGTSSPSFKLDVTGSGTTPPAKFYTSGTSSAITSYSATAGLQLISYQSDTGPFTKVAAIIANADGTAPAPLQFWTKADGAANTSNTMTLTASGNLAVGIGSSTARVTAAVEGGADRDIFAAGVIAVTNGFRVQWNNANSQIYVSIASIPTSSAGLPAGTLYSDGGTIKIA